VVQLQFVYNCRYTPVGLSQCFSYLTGRVHVGDDLSQTIFNFPFYITKSLQPDFNYTTLVLHLWYSMQLQDICWSFLKATNMIDSVYYSKIYHLKFAWLSHFIF